MDRFITAKEAMYQTEHSIVFKSKVYKWISEASNKGLCGIRVYTSNYGDSVVNKVFNSLAKDGYHVHISNYVMYTQNQSAKTVLQSFTAAADVLPMRIIFMEVYLNHMILAVPFRRREWSVL